MLTVREVRDHSLHVGCLDFSLAPGKAVLAEIIDYQVHVLIIAFGAIKGVQLPITQLHNRIRNYSNRVAFRHLAMMRGELMLIGLMCLGVIVIGLALVAKHYMTET